MCYFCTSKNSLPINSDLAVLSRCIHENITDLIKVDKKSNRAFASQNINLTFDFNILFNVHFDTLKSVYPSFFIPLDLQFRREILFGSYMCYFCHLKPLSRSLFSCVLTNYNPNGLLNDFYSS